MVVHELLTCTQQNCHETFTVLWNTYHRVSSRGRHGQIYTLQLTRHTRDVHTFGGIAMVFSGDFRHVQMRLMHASRLPSYGSMFKLCTYPLTCMFICVQVHWLESLLMSSCKMDRGASSLVWRWTTFECHQKVALS